MRPTRISSFNKSPLAKALNMANSHPKNHVIREYSTLGANQTDIFRKTVMNPNTNSFDKLRHATYDSRTGKLETMTHSYPHGQIYKDGQTYMAFINKEGIVERNIDNSKDFIKFVREFLPKIK